MNYRIENRKDEMVRALLKGKGCLATFGTEGRTTDGSGWSRERRQIMFHP